MDFARNAAGAFVRNALLIVISLGESQPEQYKCLEGIENVRIQYIYKYVSRA